MVNIGTQVLKYYQRVSIGAINLSNILVFSIVLILKFYNTGFDHDVVYYLLALGLGGMTIIWNKNRKDLIVGKYNPLFIFSLFLLWSGLSFFWSIHYVRTLIEFLQLTLAGVVFFLSMILDEEGKFRTIQVIGLVSSLIALLGILEYVFVKTGRIVSTFVNPNPFGTYLLILFLFYWGYTLRKKHWSLYLVSVVYITALFLTGSRGAYLALIISLPFLFLGIEKTRLKKSLLKTILVIGSGLGITRLLMYIAPIVQKNLGLDLSIVDNLLRVSSLIGSSSIGRVEFWKAAIRVFMEKPITGFGLGTFFQSYFIGYGGNQWYSRFAHNHYLQILAELGIVGLVLFLAFILATLWTFWKVFKAKEYPPYFIGIVAAFIGFLAHIFIEFSWNFPGVTVTMFWMLGMGVSFYKTDKKEFRIRPIWIRSISVVLLLVTLWHFGSMKAYSYGFKLEDEGKTKEAAKVYHTINTVYPINHNGFLFESNIYVKDYNESGNIEDLEKGIQLAEKAVKLAPLDGQTHTHLAQLYRTAGNMDKAEEHYILGKKYAAYVITRYRELAQFYLSQERYEEAEEVLLEASGLSEYAIISAPEVDKQAKIFDASSIHVLLFDIYKKQDNKAAMKEQADIIIEMTEEHEFLKDWYKMEMFEVD